MRSDANTNMDLAEIFCEDLELSQGVVQSFVSISEMMTFPISQPMSGIYYNYCFFFNKSVFYKALIKRYTTIINHCLLSQVYLIQMESPELTLEPHPSNSLLLVIWKQTDLPSKILTEDLFHV
jgi:hypothetical protein